MIIAKQMDIRANIREYFDMAYNGEQIIVPRKQNRNVVIISEAEYNRLSTQRRLNAYHSAFSSAKTQDTIDANNEVTSIKTDNLKKLELIRNLRDNWNGNGAPAFSRTLIDKVTDIVTKLHIQPEIFPTALQTIQLEYDNSRRDHIEIELGDSDTAEVFTVNYLGAETFTDIPSSAEAINEYLERFYG